MNTGENQHSIWTEKYRPQDFDEIVGHEEIVRRVKSMVEKENLPHLLFSGPPGVGKCVTGDTPILTGEGDLLSIEAAFDQGIETVMSLGTDGSITKHDISYLYREDAEKTLQITTKAGKTITVTPEHPFLVNNEGTPKWTETQNIEEGDFIATPSTVNAVEEYPLQITYPNCEVDDSTENAVAHKGSKKHGITAWNDVNDDIAEWLGFLHGATPEKPFKFQHSNSNVRKTFRLLTEDLFGDIATKEFNGKTKAYVEIKHTDTFEAAYNEYLDQESFLKELLRQPRRVIEGYLAGYLDAAAKQTKEGLKIQITNRIATLLSYVFLRVDTPVQITETGLNITGFTANELCRFLDLRFNTVFEERNQANIPLAAEDVAFVRETLGIRLSELPTDVRTTIQNGAAISQDALRRTYAETYYEARKRLQEGISFLDTAQHKDFDTEEFLEEDLDELESKAVRKALQKGLEKDRLSAYADHALGPQINEIDALKDLSRLQGKDETEELYDQLLNEVSLTIKISNVIDTFDISAEEILRVGRNMPVNVVYDVTERSISIQTLRSLDNLLLAVEEVIEQRIYRAKLTESLELLNYLSNVQIHWDEVQSITEHHGETVYDLNVSPTHNFIAGHGAFIAHNTTLSLVIVRQLYGEEWRQNFLELNASDERGIDVVREKVKDFARTKSLGDVPFKIIYLDESDALTRDAQQALRRTMENYTRSCRFILSCNYSSKIIDPIQSRCTIFRFSNLDEKDLNTIIDWISEEEKLKITEDGREALIQASRGDVRRLENILQTTSSITDEIDKKTVLSIASYADPEELRGIIKDAATGKFRKAKKALFKLMLRQGLSGIDVLSQLQKEIWEVQGINDQAKLRVVKDCAEAEFRLIEGADENIQIDALLATIAMRAE